MQQAAPECELLAANDRVYVRIAGGSQDSLCDVVSAAHTEFQWLYSKDDMAFVEQNQVIKAQPPSGD